MFGGELSHDDRLNIMLQVLDHIETIGTVVKDFSLALKHGRQVWLPPRSVRPQDLCSSCLGHLLALIRRRQCRIATLID